MTQLSKFGSFTKEAARTEAAQGESQAWLKLNPGTSIVRMLPPLAGKSSPWVTIYQHFIKVPGAKSVVFNCPRRMSNGRCPACEKADRLRATGNPTDEKAAREFTPSMRNIGFALDRENPEKGIQMFAFGAMIKKRLIHFREKLDKDFTHPFEGFDLVIDRTGQGLDTEYQVDLGSQGPITNNETQLDAWVSALPDLDTFAKVLSYDDIVAKFSAGGGAPAPVVEQRPSAQAIDTTAVSDDDIPF